MAKRFLRELADHLSANGVTAEFHVTGETTAFDQVLFQLDDEGKLIGSVGLLPGVSPSVLQVFVPLPVAVPKQRVNQVARTVCAINGMLPLTGFEFTEQAEVPLTFRALSPKLGAEWQLTPVTQSLAQMLELLGRFIPVLVGVADGDFDYKAARKRLAEV